MLIDFIVAKFFTDKIITVSKELETKLKAKITDNKLTTIHNSCKVASFTEHEGSSRLKAELKIDPTDYIIGCIGRLVPVKGLEHFLRAAKLTLQQIPNVTFLIIGDGPLRQSLESLAEEPMISNKVKFTGFRRDASRWLQIMDVFVVSSLHEGVPSVILEAMTSSKPVVTTKVGGIPEIVEDKVSGFLISPRDEISLACKCTTLLRDERLSGEIAKKGNERVSSSFSQKVIVNGFVSLYNNLLRSTPPQSIQTIG